MKFLRSVASDSETLAQSGFWSSCILFEGSQDLFSACRPRILAICPSPSMQMLKLHWNSARPLHDTSFPIHRPNNNCIPYYTTNTAGNGLSYKLTGKTGKSITSDGRSSIPGRTQSFLFALTIRRAVRASYLMQARQQQREGDQSATPRIRATTSSPLYAFMVRRLRTRKKTYDPHVTDDACGVKQGDLLLADFSER